MEMMPRIHHAAPWIARYKELLLTCTAVALLAGCSPQNVRIGENIEVAVPARQIQRSVGVYYDESFKGYVHTAVRYGDTWTFPLGEASVNEFNDAFSKLFSSTRLVSKRPSSSASYNGLDGVIVPKIESFEFFKPLVQSHVFTSEVTYRFTLYDVTAKEVGSWVVTGRGKKQGKVGFHVPTKWQAAATDLAIQNALEQFIAEFSLIPEVHAWLGGKPIDIYHPSGDFKALATTGTGVSGLGTVAVFKKIAKVTVDPFSDPSRQESIFGRETTSAGIFPVRVSIINAGRQDLAVRPAEIAVRLPGLGAVSQMSIYDMAAALKVDQGRTAAVAPGIGHGIPALISAFSNAQAIMKEAEEEEDWIGVLEKYRLDSLTVKPGDSLEGFVFFEKPQTIVKATNPELVMPVSDLQNGRQFVLRVPFRP